MDFRQVISETDHRVSTQVLEVTRELTRTHHDNQPLSPPGSCLSPYIGLGAGMEGESKVNISPHPVSCLQFTVSEENTRKLLEIH